MSKATIRAWNDLPKAIINPNIYGSFAEHLGKCVYEGIWVGPKSRIPNDNGLRLDILAAMKQLRTPVVRWPGGCFADTYHWRDGIGPAGSRPARVNIWWQQTEPNSFGTDEFMRFCQVVGCAPYICVNVGSGAPQEARDWVEYCNFGGDSTLAQMRTANGGTRPYGVKYWGVGNENWACGGAFSATEYAAAYKNFALYMYGQDRSIELIACGCDSGDGSRPDWAEWNHDFLNAMRTDILIHHLSIHKYFKRGEGAAFSDSEFQALFGDLLSLERDIQRGDQLLGYFFPEKHVGLVIDEWGTWHPGASAENGLEQVSTLRDGVFAGAALNLFNRYAHRVTMTNIAQTINVLQAVAMTGGAKMFLTPTYHAYDMTRPHMGAELLTQEVDCPEFEAHPVGLKRKRPVQILNASVSRKGKRLLLTVANQSAHEDVETAIDLRGVKVASVVARELNAPDPRAMNTFDNPKAVVPKRLKVEPKKGVVEHVFPAHSFTGLSLTLE